MTREEFVQLVNDDVTADCSLPINVPQKSIDRIIDKKAKPWFYRNYEYSLEDKYLIIQQGYENTPMFKANRAVKLPDCVYGVYSVRKEGRRLGSDIDKDFGYDKFIVDQANGSLSSSPDNLTYATFLMLYLDVVDQMTTVSVTFNYNNLTHSLILNGEVHHGDLIATVAKKIPDEALFEDDYFLRYVVAEVKKNIGTALGTVKMGLIGGADIDFDSIKSEGVDELQEVKDDISGEDAADFFFMSPQ